MHIPGCARPQWNLCVFVLLNEQLTRFVYSSVCLTAVESMRICASERVISFFFILRFRVSFSFVGLAKVMGQGGRDFTFQSSLSCLAVSSFFPCGFFYLFYSLKSSYVRVLDSQGLADSGLINPPYSVREWCRFLTKLSRLLSKSDCFQPVSFDSLCNPQFRCRGVSIISFACVMTDSSTLKNSQTAAEGPQSSIFVSYLCLLAEM